MSLKHLKVIWASLERVRVSQNANFWIKTHVEIQNLVITQNIFTTEKITVIIEFYVPKNILYTNFNYNPCTEKAVMNIFILKKKHLTRPAIPRECIKDLSLINYNVTSIWKTIVEPNLLIMSLKNLRVISNNPKIA